MKDGLLRNQPMRLGLQSPPPPKIVGGPIALRCFCKREGTHSLDAGRTWFCAAHKPEQRS